MADTSSLRADRLIWWTRLIQCLFVIILLGVTGRWSTQWANVGCSPPTKVAFNVACATLCFLLLLFLIPTTGPLSKTPFWNRWVQLAIDAFFLILWIAAAAASEENCTDLCRACHYPKFGIIGWVSWESVYCKCPSDGEAIPYTPILDKRQSSPATHLMRRGPVTTEGSAALKTLTKAGEMGLKKGLDAALVLLFALTLFYGLYKILHKPNPETGNVEMTDEQHENMGKMGEGVTETAVPGP